MVVFDWGGIMVVADLSGVMVPLDWGGMVVLAVVCIGLRGDHGCFERDI